LPASVEVVAGRGEFLPLANESVDLALAATVLTHLPIARERRFFSSINYVMAVFNTVGVAWLTGYAIAVARGRAFLQRPRVVATSTI